MLRMGGFKLHSLRFSCASPIARDYVDNVRNTHNKTERELFACL